MASRNFPSLGRISQSSPEQLPLNRARGFRARAVYQPFFLWYSIRASTADSASKFDHRNAYNLFHITLLGIGKIQ